MGNQPGLNMAALLFNLVQKIFRIVGPSAIHNNQPAFPVFNNHGQKLCIGIMICKHGKAARAKQ